MKSKRYFILLMCLLSSNFNFASNTVKLDIDSSAPIFFNNSIDYNTDADKPICYDGVFSYDLNEMKNGEVKLKRIKKNDSIYNLFKSRSIFINNDVKLLNELKFKYYKYLRINDTASFDYNYDEKKYFELNIQNVLIDSLVLEELFNSINKLTSAYGVINFKGCIINTISTFKNRNSKGSNGFLDCKYDINFDNCNINDGSITDIKFISNYGFRENLNINNCINQSLSIFSCDFTKSFYFRQPYAIFGPKGNSKPFYKNIIISNCKFRRNVDLFIEDTTYSYSFIENELYNIRYGEYYLNNIVRMNPYLYIEGSLRNHTIKGNVISNLYFSLKYTEVPIDFSNCIFYNCRFGYINTNVAVYLSNNKFISTDNNPVHFTSFVNGNLSNTNFINSLITTNDEICIISYPDNFNFEDYDIDILDKIIFNCTYFLYNQPFVVNSNNKTNLILLKKEEFNNRLDNFFLRYENFVRKKYVSTNTAKMDIILAHMNYNKEQIQWMYYIETWNIPLVIWYWIKRVTINFGYNGLTNFFFTCFVIILLFGFVYYFKFNKDIKIYHDEEDEPIRELKNEIVISYNTENLSTIKNFFLKFFSLLFLLIMPLFLLVRLIKKIIARILIKLSRYKIIKPLVIIYNAIGEFINIIKSLVRVENIKVLTSCMWFSFRTLIDIRFPSVSVPKSQTV